MKRSFLILFFLALTLSSCTFLSKEDVAAIGKHKISRGELYRFIPEETFKALGPDEKKQQVDLICDSYLSRHFLEDSGDLDSGEVKWEIEVWKTLEYANRAYQHLVINKILTPEAERDLYDRLKYEINVSHLLIGFNNSRSLNARTREEAAALAAEIKEKITGDNFEELVSLYSDDASKAENRGHLGWGGSGHWVIDFEDAAYSLHPGEISGPVETDFGFHIIRMNERREIPVDPFETLQGELREIAFNKWRLRFMLRENAVFDSLVMTNPIVYDDSMLVRFMDRFSRLSVNVFYSEQFTAFDILDIFEDTLTVGRIGDTPIDKAWIYRYLKVLNLQMPPRFTDIASFKSFVEHNKLGDYLNKAAKNLGVERSKDYIHTYNVYLAKKSSSLFDKLYVFDAMNPDSRQLGEFYEQNKERLYLNEATVQVREVLLGDSLFAEEILSRARAGESMADLAAAYSVRNIGKNKQGLIPPVKRHQYGEMGLAAFNMKDGEIAGPFRIGKHFSVIQRINRIPESVKSKQEVQYRLLTDFRREHSAEKRAEQREMLRKKYRVRINPLYIK